MPKGSSVQLSSHVLSGEPDQPVLVSLRQGSKEVLETVQVTLACASDPALCRSLVYHGVAWCPSLYECATCLSGGFCHHLSS